MICVQRGKGVYAKQDFAPRIELVFSNLPCGKSFISKRAYHDAGNLYERA